MTLLETLRLALEALEHSEPKMKHYSEPMMRHRDAISAISIAIDENIEHCEACGGDGILHVSAEVSDPPAGMLYIQRCDLCERYTDDFEAAANCGRTILAVLVQDVPAKSREANTK